MITPPKRVLCVEDYNDAFSLITSLLSDCEVTGASSKAEALRKASEQQFDLYLIDYHLPDGTGLEVCRGIRAFDRDAPILFCTATASLTVKEARKAGAQDIIWKGAGFAENLGRAVSGIFEGRK